MSRIFSTLGTRLGQFVFIGFLTPAGVALSMAILPSLSTAQAAEHFKDLQVLPKNIERPVLKNVMKAQAKALGVDCDFCHKEPTMEADTPKKTIAREMMRMTDELNQKYKNTTHGNVTCTTCHRGQKSPAG